MLTLTVEAKTYAELVDKAKSVLGIGITETKAINVAPVVLGVDLARPNSDQTVWVLPDHPEKIDLSAGGDNSVPVQPKRRGRPPKVKDAAQESVAPPSTGPSPAPTPAPAAVVSDPPTAPAASVTFDQMKAALQKVAAARKGETDDMAGLKRASAVLGQFKTATGEACRKVKEVQEKDYATIVRVCEVMVKEAPE